MLPKIEITSEGTCADGIPFVRLSGCGNFSVFKTFDCGQCFRFDPTPSENGEYTVSGVAFGRRISVAQSCEGDGSLTLYGSDSYDFDRIWKHYLSLDTDYDEIDEAITTALDSHGCNVMKNAARLSRGIRILRQDPWEALCSFIISQNNNIPRIKKIISALCEKFGDATTDGRGKTFPTPEALAAADESDIFALKTGFRAAYISDAARRVASGDVDFSAIESAESFDECDAMLRKIRGVGPKVSACTLLFGFGRLDAYPIDTWMRKVEAHHFPDGLDHTKFGKYAGVAQQYLFYTERYINQ